MFGYGYSTKEKKWFTRVQINDNIFLMSRAMSRNLKKRDSQRNSGKEQQRMPKSIISNRKASFAVLGGIYLLAGIAGVLLFTYLPYSYWLNLLLSDVAVTFIIFLFSLLFRNASVYDPYWSVFPLVAVLLLARGTPLTMLNFLHIAAVCFWGIRLTGNWAYTFHGLDSQDWRYTMLEQKTGKWYPAVNLLGIHLVPTLIVYLCFLPVAYAMYHHLDTNLAGFVCITVSVCAVVWQGIADYQMHTFRKSHRGELLREGLWTYSRHPNYLGEIVMWWGIGLSVLFAAPGRLWLITGALVNTLLFLFISIPMADEHQSRKDGFEDYKAKTRMLLPFKPR